MELISQVNFKMGWIKQFLTTENIPFFDFEISTFILTSILIIMVFCIILKIKNKSISKNLINCAFLSLSSVTFLFALLNALTGEFLFSQKENVKVYMLIAAVALWIYIIDTTRKIFTSKE